MDKNNTLVQPNLIASTTGLKINSSLKPKNAAFHLVSLLFQRELKLYKNIIQYVGKWKQWEINLSQ